MQTGEGKTLTSVFPLIINALNNKNCHVVTVNDYLAKRDSEFLKPIFSFFNLTVGYIYNDQYQVDKKSNYESNIVYGTNNFR